MTNNYKKTQKIVHTAWTIKIKFHFIFLKASTLSSILGCVDHKLEEDFLPLKGLTIYIFSVALLATFNSLGSPEIFKSAEIKPSGSYDRLR